MNAFNRDTIDYFHHLRQKIRAEIASGRLDAALELCDEAIEWARELGSTEDLDHAICNRAGILIARGEGDGAVSDLRRILMRSATPSSSFHAAHAISVYHELRQESVKGLFYARLAVSHSEKADSAEFLSSACNKLAILLATDSEFAEASDNFRRALANSAEGDSLQRALILANLGYCLSVQEELPEGFDLLFRSLRMMNRLGIEAWQRIPRLGLTFAYLEVDRPAAARRHGRRALDISEKAEGCDQHVKHALYLLGETEKQAGHEEKAYELFCGLQDRFYPDEPFVVDLLMATDTRKLVNLMA